MSRGQLTIAIVTKKRPEKLNRCLRSIAEQTVLPERVLVIDNDVDRSAKKTVELFSKSLPIRYLFEPKPGIPQSRNRALRSCKSRLIGFVDDDCVLDKNWVRVGEETASKNKAAAYIVGRVLLLNKQSIVAQTQFNINEYWLERKIDRETFQLDSQGLDTKNIIFKTSYLKKHQIFFDSKFAKNPFGGWADTDLGMQLDSVGLKGYFQLKMKVFHEEIEEVLTFLKKAYYRGKTAYLFYSKWNLNKELVALSDLKLYRWFLSLSNLPKEFRSIKKGPFLNRIAIVWLKRIYKRVHLQGFLDQRRELQANRS